MLIYFKAVLVSVGCMLGAFVVTLFIDPPKYMLLVVFVLSFSAFALGCMIWISHTQKNRKTDKS